MDALFAAATVSNALGLRLRVEVAARGRLVAGLLEVDATRDVLVVVGFLRGRGSGNSISSSS